MSGSASDEAYRRQKAPAVSHFLPASTILTENCPPEKLSGRPLNEQDDTWIRMRGTRRQLASDAANNGSSASIP